MRNGLACHSKNETGSQLQDGFRGGCRWQRDCVTIASQGVRFEEKLPQPATCCIMMKRSPKNSSVSEVTRSFWELEDGPRSLADRGGGHDSIHTTRPAREDYISTTANVKPRRIVLRFWFILGHRPDSVAIKLASLVREFPVFQRLHTLFQQVLKCNWGVWKGFRHGLGSRSAGMRKG